MDSKSRHIERFLSALFFVAVFSAMISRFLFYDSLSIALQLLATVILGVLYFRNSTVKGSWFILLSIVLALSILLVGNGMLFWNRLGVVALIIELSIVLWAMFKLVRIYSYSVAWLISAPLFLMFFYFANITTDMTSFDRTVVIVQSILVSIYAATAALLFIKTENRENSILLISALLFLGWSFVSFIENYYGAMLGLTVFAPLVIPLNLSAFYAFYKFCIIAENRKLETH